MSDDQQHALDLIGIHTRRLRELEKQAALYGARVDAAVTIEIEDLQKKINSLEPLAERSVSGLGIPVALMTADGSPQPTHLLAKIPHPTVEPNFAGIFPGTQQQGVLAYHRAALVLDPPPIQPWIGRRTETVSRLVTDTKSRTWAALHGNAGRGKTRLARLLAEAFGGPIIWVPFAGLEDEGSTFLLERLCAHYAKQSPPAHRATWYRAASQAIGSGSVLVLDDLPNLATTPGFVTRLEPVIRECAESEVRVISTSMFPVPTSVLNDLKDIGEDIPAPMFTNKDVEEVLRAFKAPEPIVTRAARLINLVSRQHPTLIVAACRYLETLYWTLDDEGIEGLFKGEHTAGLASEVQHKLLATVPDPKARQLLYRLAIIGATFSGQELDVVANVPQPIESAREKLRNMTNSWVEPQGDGKWALSPVIGNAVLDNLPTEEKRACHMALGEQIVRRETMDQHTGYVAVTHFVKAGELGKAGSILLMLLNAAQEHIAKMADDMILRIWTNEPIPDGMNLNLRLTIRGLHIALFHKLGKPLDFLFSDLDSLMSQVTARERLGAAGAVSFVLMAVGRKYPMQAGRWFRRFLKIPVPASRRSGKQHPVKRKEQPELALGDEFPIHVLIWMLIGELNTAEQVGDWLDTVESLPPDIRRKSFVGISTEDDAHVRCVVIADTLTGAEQAKPPEVRDWPEVTAKLTEFATRARTLSVEVLWASFIRAKIMVQAEFCADVDGALATAVESAGLASGDPLVGFMIDGTIGRQLLLAKRYSDARLWLGRAIDRKTDAVFAYDRVNVLLGASHAFGLEVPAVGVKYALEAAMVAESDDGVPAIDRVRAWSELGVAQFYASGPAAAIESWDKAGEYLFTMTDRDDAWKEQMVLFGHTSGYIAKVAETGNPPTLTHAGEVYAAPARGVFMTTNAGRVTFFNARIEGPLWRVLGYLADAVGNAEMGVKWRTRAAETGRRDSILALVAEAGRDEIVKVLREEGYLAAMTAGRRAAQAMVVFSSETKAGNTGIVPEEDMPATLARLSEQDRLACEEFGMIIGLIPCVLSVATHPFRAATAAGARVEAEKLVAACRTNAYQSFTPQRWEWVAEVIERGFVFDHSEHLIAELGRNFAGTITDSLRFVLHLARATKATPGDSFGVMLPIMPRLCGWWPASTAVHRELLMPFVAAYWTHRFHNERFLFGLAMVIESLLPQAMAEPEADRVVAIFRALHTGFRVKKLPEECRKWLFGT